MRNGTAPPRPTARARQYDCRVAGRFHLVTLGCPKDAGDSDKIAASSDKGVITVTIPKKPEAQPKKIAIKAKD